MRTSSPFARTCPRTLVHLTCTCPWRGPGPATGRWSTLSRPDPQRRPPPDHPAPRAQPQGTPNVEKPVKAGESHTPANTQHSEIADKALRESPSVDQGSALVGTPHCDTAMGFSRGPSEAQRERAIGTSPHCSRSDAEEAFSPRHRVRLLRGTPLTPQSEVPAKPQAAVEVFRSGWPRETSPPGILCLVAEA